MINHMNGSYSLRAPHTIQRRLRPCIFLDRDGTIIVDKIFLNDPEQIEYLPGVFESLRKLRDMGFIFAVVTNQSGMARGLVQIENLNEIHRRITFTMASHGIEMTRYYYAPFLVESDHIMRKPKPGMILSATEDHGIDLSQSWMIGDRMSDIEAGYNSGIHRCILIGEQTINISQTRVPILNTWPMISNYIESQYNAY